MPFHATHTPGAVHSYTAAFDELDLSWNWDPATHGEGREALRKYVESELPHLLRAYDAEFLMDAVESTRARLHGAR
jgi:hypothetical protein